MIDGVYNEIPSKYFFKRIDEYMYPRDNKLIFGIISLVLGQIIFKFIKKFWMI